MNNTKQFHAHVQCLEASLAERIEMKKYIILNSNELILMMKLSILLLIFVAYGDIKPIDQTSFYKGLVPDTNFYSETGYVNVKDKYDNNFYYYLYL